MKHIFKASIAAAAAGGMLLVSTMPVLGYSRISIWRNGANSTNRVNFSSFRNTVVSQSNDFSVNNTVIATSRTGRNSIFGTTGGESVIVTGNSSTSVKITTSGNTNIAHVDECCEEDPCPTPSPEPTPTPTPTPPPVCEEVEDWAGDVDASEQGTTKSGGEITDPDRTDPNDVLGTPDSEFFSIGKDGWIVVTFDNPVTNSEGDDLSFHEVTNDRDTYPEEKATVEVSDDNSTWHSIGEVSNHATDGIAYLDIDSTGLDTVMYVRISDNTDYSLHGDAADGYDLDAVDGVTLVCEEEV